MGSWREFLSAPDQNLPSQSDGLVLMTSTLVGFGQKSESCDDLKVVWPEDLKPVAQHSFQHVDGFGKTPGVREDHSEHITGFECDSMASTKYPLPIFEHEAVCDSALEPSIPKLNRNASASAPTIPSTWTGDCPTSSR